VEQSRGSDRTTKEVLRTIARNYVALVLPDALSVDGKITTELRSRSIYSARVYTADLRVSGSFIKPNLTGLRPNIAEVHWDKASLAVGISSTRAIRGVSELELAGESLKFQPGTGGLRALPTGFSGAADLSRVPNGEVFKFDFQVSVGGSERLYLTPLGVNSSFRLNSDWPHPSFTGSGLPSSREITARGFSAEWNIPNLVRNYPQADDSDAWRNATANHQRYGNEPGEGVHNLGEYVTGVEFFEPVFHYSLLTRAVKYALLFIALTFLGVVIFENYSGKRNNIRLNMTQYGVIGLGLSLFYLTLLAASEHMDFTPAYFLAAALNVAMTSGYVMAALRRGAPALLTAGVQGLLYALLFFILRMEDYALLAGTSLLILATLALMAVTKNTNRPAEPKTETPNITR
jgi:inner membrane protein